jgi:hypothetical protein
MATSGTYSYNDTTIQIVQDALSLIGVYGAEDTLTAADYKFAVRMLNKLLKAWEASELNLWVKEEGTLFFQPNQYKYDLGSGVIDAANAGSYPIVETTTTATVAGGIGVIPCTTVTGMTIGDIFGVLLDTGSVQWSTITNITSLNVTLNNTLTSQATAGAYVYDYTTTVPRPYNITQCRLIDSSGFERVLTRMRREDYFRMPQKTLASIPSFWYYDPQLNYGSLFFWPSIDDASYRVRFTYLRTVNDLVLSTNTADVPQEWLLAVTTNLAVQLAPAYGRHNLVGQVGAGLLGDQARDALKMASGFNVDEGNTQFVFDPGEDDFT